MGIPTPCKAAKSTGNVCPRFAIGGVRLGNTGGNSNGNVDGIHFSYLNDRDGSHTL